jgi:hypothetical protein
MNEIMIGGALAAAAIAAGVWVWRAHSKANSPANVRNLIVDEVNRRDAIQRGQMSISESERVLAQRQATADSMFLMTGGMGSPMNSALMMNAAVSQQQEIDRERRRLERERIERERIEQLRLLELDAIAAQQAIFSPTHRSHTITSVRGDDDFEIGIGSTFSRVVDNTPVSPSRLEPEPPRSATFEPVTYARTPDPEPTPSRSYSYEAPSTPSYSSRSSCDDSPSSSSSYNND